ncbi:MAG: fibronectin type III domain-containing protein, partial [candidate division NC10 bacterium]|nr:fibronectin type III domain-containing protein [candidate division NC10 bacterium]
MYSAKFTSRLVGLPLLLRVAFALALTLCFTELVAGHAEAYYRRSKPDLTVPAVSAPSSASSGATIVVSDTIKNQGTAASNAFSVAYYLSKSPSSTTGAAVLGTQNISSLAAGASVALVTSFTVPGSTASGTFYVVVVADSTNVINESNESNNIASSGAISIKNSTPPTISSVTSSGITASSATVTWNTDKSSTSQADYGTTAAYGSATALNSSLVTSHAVTLSGLTAGKAYHFQVQSKDAAGNAALSSDYTFTTASAGAGGETVSYYQAIYDAEYQNNQTTLDAMAASGDGGTYYTFQYVFGGTLSMYEATHDVKYLERALAWAETMVSKATIIDSNGNHNWSGPWS